MKPLPPPTYLMIVFIEFLEKDTGLHKNLSTLAKLFIQAFTLRVWYDYEE